ncbi:MAG: glycosyltransferase family 92 protein [Rickettsiaceae bacterium]
MLKNRNKYLYIFGFVVLIITSLRLLELNKNEKFLNCFAHYYFDQDYYLKHYPEVKVQNINPFDHYIKHGWKEGKNPSETFETTFYVRQYLYTNKYNLNPLADYIKSKLSFKDSHITNHTQILKAELLPNPKYYLSLVAFLQNEARFLKEWIEFHRLMGVEHFYLYNHLSNDNYMEVIEPYIKDGIVELKQVTEKPKDIKEWNRLQTRIYTDAAHALKNVTEWLVVIDTDEFLFPLKEKNLVELLKKYDAYASLSINWKIFGSGALEKVMPDKLMVESLLMSSNQKDLHVKTIVKPRYVKDFDSPHFAHLFLGYSQVTENFEYFKGPFLPEESRNHIRINHYWARDWEFFKLNKLARVHIIARGLSDDGQKAKIDALIKFNRDASIIYDDSIVAYVKALRARIEKNQ